MEGQEEPAVVARTPWRLWLWLALGALAASLAFLALPRVPTGAGASWDDAGPEGHSRLVQALSEERPVRVIGSSLGVLPASGADEGLLLLFPTHRPPSSLEVRHVQRFVAGGGTLVVAADGQNAGPWAEALGVRFKGLPALLPSDLEGGCIHVAFPTPAADGSVCLPSPTTFPNATTVSGETVLSLFNSSVPVFLDTNLDGNLSLGDQGPVVAPMILQWEHGRGRAIAIADADLWRNGVLDDAPGNLDALAGLVHKAQTVYLDSSGAQPTLATKLRNPPYRALAAPEVAQAIALVAMSVGALGIVAGAPRVRAFARHDPPADAGDSAVEAAGLAAIHAALRDGATVRPALSPTRQQNGGTS